MRVVLDTSVIISALRSSSGAAAETVRLALLGVMPILMDYKLALEYRDVALRPDQLAASGKSPQETGVLLDALESLAEPVLVTSGYRQLSSDPDDDMVLEVAIHGRADAIITGNARHFRSPAGRFGIRVLTPREFLAELQRRD